MNPAPAVGTPGSPYGLPTGITTVLFDLDDTLVPYLPCWTTALDTVTQHLAHTHSGVSGPAIAAAYTRVSDTLWRDYEQALAHLGPTPVIRAHVWRTALHECGIQPDERELGALVAYFARQQHLAITPDRQTAALLERLALRYRLGVVTNGDRATQHAKLGHAGLDGAFETVVCALDTGARKPDPAPFLHACSDLSVAPEQCLYVGDSWANDVVGAHGAGMHPVWICPDTVPAPPGRPAAARFPDLPSCLNALAAHAVRRPARETEPT
ncbi:HAD family hydrolase [Streptomyces sp. NPDC048448]|uniref:HAD family hydrolase n=1 Tax=Streptomyces sp. NPDC048448 TaxID=3365554 RepID=UPI00371142BC